MSDLLQLAGLLCIAAALYLWTGPAGGLAAAGITLLIVGEAVSKRAEK